MTEFVQSGKLTEAGRKVIEAIEGIIGDDKKKSIDQLNNMPGYVKHYMVNVKKAQLLTQEAWLRDYPNSAQLMLDLIVAQEAAQEQAEAVKENAEKTSDLERQLESLREEFKKEVASLKRENSKLKKQLAEAEEEAVDPDEDDEDDEEEEGVKPEKD